MGNRLYRGEQLAGRDIGEQRNDIYREEEKCVGEQQTGIYRI